MKTTLLCLFCFISVTAVFVAVNNIPAIPAEYIPALWYGYPPLLALSLGYVRGRANKKSGTTVPLLALTACPLLYFATKYPMPFTSTFCNVPVLISAIPCALLGEIMGRPGKKT